MEISWNCVFEFLWEPCHIQICQGFDCLLTQSMDVDDDYLKLRPLPVDMSGGFWAYAIKQKISA